MPTPTTRIAVLGAGAFGRNHIRILRELAATGHPVQLAAIVDPNPAALATYADSGAQLFPNLESLLAAHSAGTLQLDAASICVPTSAHHVVSAALLGAGLHLLIEKPITSTLAEADHLIALAAQHRRILQVGHLERFNPAVQALPALTTQPMFFEAHRLSVFSPRALDVDVVLDLMIHDLDIVLQLANSPVHEVRATGLPILSPHADIANARVEFLSGAVANFTASRVSTERVRKLRFFQPHQYVSVDYARQDLLLVSVLPGASASQPLSFKKPPITQAEPLRLEIESFLKAIFTGEQPAITATQARDALALALDIQTAIHAHSERAQLARFHPKLQQ